MFSGHPVKLVGAIVIGLFNGFKVSIKSSIKEKPLITFIIGLITIVLVFWIGINIVLKIGKSKNPANILQGFLFYILFSKSRNQT